MKECSRNKVEGLDTLLSVFFGVFLHFGIRGEECMHLSFILSFFQPVRLDNIYLFILLFIYHFYLFICSFFRLLGMVKMRLALIAYCR